ncbi:uncharacterized protein EV422DRAFT_565727 [Fimicolochytrium jonesii]|uniref:uncharacterized protein n=1 Tax=Fimicolochytrium jonesii TaxID=1396493 RepID=UPI0022FF0258|nr:uncharacterized protein EV422DRAFT_565727 [Fimicolochytrium jonesii]KAI8822869.1 hypothetical protein EV422DRAFT_565727 [Fimicolochytrium jonesii]
MLDTVSLFASALNVSLVDPLTDLTLIAQDSCHTTATYRGRLGHIPVLVKAASQDGPRGVEAVAQLRHEYNIIKHLLVDRSAQMLSPPATRIRQSPADGFGAAASLTPGMSTSSSSLYKSAHEGMIALPDAIFPLESPGTASSAEGYFAMPRQRSSNGLVPNVQTAIIPPFPFSSSAQGLLLPFPDYSEFTLHGILERRGKPFPVLAALKLIQQIGMALVFIHDGGITHKNLSSSSIVAAPKAPSDPECEDFDVRIVDFGHASRLETEKYSVNLNPGMSPVGLEGDLAYMAPEATGRTSRSLDYRADFYSLGCVFYELLTMQTPFKSSDLGPAELVFAHLARSPPPLPDSIHPKCAEMVFKMLSKNAEDRYQHAMGISADCNRLSTLLRRTHHRNGTVAHNHRGLARFTPGIYDARSRLVFPNKLYGREEEIQKLLDSLEITRKGRPVLCSVGGYSGVGKSALISEIHTPVVTGGSWFAASKVDQFSARLPFHSFIQAFRELVANILASPVELLDAFRAKFDELIGADGLGGIIVQICPQLEQVVGLQPVAANLEQAQRKQRFITVMLKFIQVFTSLPSNIGDDRRMLVLVLDDMQWADTGTLNMISSIMSDPEKSLGGVLLILAYRNNEVDKLHPLSEILTSLRKAPDVQRYLIEIELKPLDPTAVAELIADTLGWEKARRVPSITHSSSALARSASESSDSDTSDHETSSAAGSSYGSLPGTPSASAHGSFSSLPGKEEAPPAKAMSLTKLVHAQTAGNPFFLLQLLKSFHQTDSLTFNWTKRKWIWDPASVSEAGLAENVVDFMVTQMRKLTLNGQRVLSLAACIGDTFNLFMISKLHEKPVDATVTELWEGVEGGYIVPLDQSYKVPLALSGYAGSEHLQGGTAHIRVNYKFQHDRVQQAAMLLLSEEERVQTHLKVGQLLIMYTPPNEVQDRIFEIVNQLNKGQSLITSERAREECAKYNCMAGTKAKDAAFADTASEYFKVGLEMLGGEEASWGRNYDLAKQLHLDLIEAEYNCCRYTRAKDLIDNAKLNLRNVTEKAQLGLIEVKYWTSQGLTQEAIATGLDVLTVLGCPIPPAGSPEVDALRAGLDLTDAEIQHLEHARMMDENENTAKALEMMSALIPPIYFGAPELLVPLILTMVRISVDNGNTASSCYGYILYGLLLCGVYQEMTKGYVWGCVGKNLVSDHWENDPIKCQVYKVFASHIQPWTEPVRECMQSYKIAWNHGLATCNFEYMGYAATEDMMYSVLSGENLSEIDEKSTQQANKVYEQKQAIGSAYIRITHQLVKTLIGNPEAEPKDTTMLVGEVFDERTMLTPEVQKMQLCIFAYHCYKLILAYVFREYDQAVEQAALAESVVAGGVGLLLVAELSFYQSLALLAVADIDSPSWPAAEETVIRNQKQMQVYADSAPGNFLHKYKLVQAEYERVAGNKYVAMELYDEAIAMARTNRFTHEEALASELAAEYYAAAGKMNVAGAYAADAFYAYVLWGSKAKTAQLQSMGGMWSWLSAGRTSKIEEKHDEIDIEALLNATRAISTEIVFPRLVKQVIANIIRNTGASRAFLMQVRDHDLVLVSSGSLAVRNPNEATTNPNALDEMSDAPKAGDQAANGTPRPSVAAVDGQPASQTSSSSYFSGANGSKLDIKVTESAISITDASAEVPACLINYVYRTQQVAMSTCLPDSLRRACLVEPCLRMRKPQSLLCTPVLLQGKMTAILYLENDLIAGAFTESRLKILQILVSTAAAALENASLYKRLQDYSFNLSNMVEQRTKQLQEKNAILEVEVQERIKAQQDTHEALEMAKAATLAKSSFLANMSHEIRTPMNAIIGMANCLLESGLNTLQEDYANIIHTSGDELLSIINDILDFSKIESGKLDLEEVPFSLRTCIEGALDLLVPKAAERNLELLYVNNDEPGTFVGDPTRLRQILVNLLSNAVKFTTNGEVVVSVENRRLDQAGDTPMEEGFYEITLKVKDTGIGIPADRMHRLFQSFSQVDSSTTRTHGGTGLGLVISKRLAEMMGGTMWVESESGVGSTFFFTIRVRAAPDVDADAVDHMQILQGKGVLVVDDNRTNRRILEQFCSSWGMRVKCVGSGEEALKALETDSGFDLALLDMIMPNMDGYTLATRIRHLSQKPKTMPLVLLTSMGCRFGEEEKQIAQFSAMMIKPIKKLRLKQQLVEMFLRLERMSLSPVKTHPSTPLTPLKSPSVQELVDEETIGVNGNSSPTPDVKPRHPDTLDHQRKQGSFLIFGPSTIEETPKASPKITKRRLQSGKRGSSTEDLELLQRAKILLAEDNPINQKVAVHMLKRVGITMDIVENGKLALEAVMKSHYDLVLMDHMMPVMDGLTSTRLIRSSLPPDQQPRIISLTANAMMGDREASLAAGSDEYCSKPIKLDALLDAMLRCLDPDDAANSSPDMKPIREEPARARSQNHSRRPSASALPPLPQRSKTDG